MKNSFTLSPYSQQQSSSVPHTHTHTMPVMPTSAQNTHRLSLSLSLSRSTLGCKIHVRKRERQWHFKPLVPVVWCTCVCFCAFVPITAHALGCRKIVWMRVQPWCKITLRANCKSEGVIWTAGKTPGYSHYSPSQLRDAWGHTDTQTIDREDERNKTYRSQETKFNTFNSTVITLFNTSLVFFLFYEIHSASTASMRPKWSPSVK